jgi:hypothetical protein
MSEQLNPGQNPEWERPKEKQDFKKDEAGAFQITKGPNEKLSKEPTQEFEKINEIPVKREEEFYEKDRKPSEEPDDNQKNGENSDQPDGN